MSQLRITSLRLVLRAALLTLLTGCGVFTGTKAPLPVGSEPSSGNTTVAPSGLQLGYVWQPDSHNLYPILGVGGASHYGPGVLAASTTVVTAAATGSANGSWALLLHNDGTLQELQLPTSTSSTLAAGVALDSTVAFSPSGTSAAIVSASIRAVVIVSGLPSKPAVASLQLPSGSSIAGFAVSDGGTMLAGLKQSGNAGVQLGTISELHSYSAIGTVQGWGGATFVPGVATGSTSEAAVVADGVAAQVAYITNIGGSSAVVSSLATAGLLQTAVGVGVSPDGQWAFIADSGKPQIVRVSIAQAGTAATSIACACKPAQLSALTGNGMYAVTGSAAGQPSWILDTRAETPRAFFVPAIPLTTSTQTASTATQQPVSGASR